MLAISNKNLKLLSSSIIAITVLINIAAFFILPDQILVQINQSHTMSKLFVLPMIPILQFLIFTISREIYDSTLKIIGLIIIFIADIAVIAMNLI
ncbi:hypothetical protein CHL78_007300 [Romboutsia weinsteinii]|uniref:Uncharacterized protein n=1 Tax=Romboutsia weinsteinii TaxID=2020949 RepID=A0A371J5N8_9FIRM|nr:hypothetical protein [Romboutsia weinsteinii]RDY28100.1 hypothetical protein CHL78_007300 [Romboutsia weinsteinii]